MYSISVYALYRRCLSEQTLKANLRIAVPNITHIDLLCENSQTHPSHKFSKFVLQIYRAIYIVFLFMRVYLFQIKNYYNIFSKYVSMLKIIYLFTIHFICVRSCLYKTNKLILE